PVVLPAATAGRLDGAFGSLEELEASEGNPTGPHQPDDARTDGAPARDVLAGPSGNGHHPAPDGLEASMPPAPPNGNEEQLPLTTIDDGLALYEPAMVVEVLGTPTVPDRPGLGRRELILTVLLACRAGPVAASAVQDA